MPTGSPGNPRENGGPPAERAAPYERLERAGRGAWWVIGLIVLAGVALYLLRRYESFVFPSLVGIVLATTLSPVVGWMERRRVPRLLGAVIVSIVIVLLLVALAWAAVVIVVDQGPQIWHTLSEGGARIDRWLGGTGEASDTVSRVENAIGGLRSGLSNVVPIALEGVHELYTLVVAVFLAGGFTFFFLWEGPLVRRWVSRHMAQPEEVGLRITSSLVRTTRRYVAGLSGIGATEAVVVGVTAAVVGESAWPLIALVIFIGNYIPYIGGIVAGAFAVLLTLGDLGVGPAVVVLIAIVISFFGGSHIGAFFIGGALRLPVTAVFVLTMAGAAVAGLFGAAATAPLARLIIDARDITRESRAESAEAAAVDDAGAASGGREPEPAGHDPGPGGAAPAGS
jgi:predicted PurR-regulated permease PerM